MLKFEAQLWSKFRTLENQFELPSGRFVNPELPFKFWPRIQAKKIKTPQKTATTRNPNVSFCRKKRFRGKKGRKLRFSFALGLLAFLWPKASKHNSAKNTIEQGGLLFCLCFLWSVCPKTRRNNKTTTTATTTTTTTTIRTIRTKQAEQRKHQNKRQHQTNKQNNISENMLLFFGCYFFGFLLLPKQPERTTKPQYNKTTSKQQKQYPKIKRKQQQEEQLMSSFRFLPFF